jgi:hypothetical protein
MKGSMSLYEHPRVCCLSLTEDIARDGIVKALTRPQPYWHPEFRHSTVRK